MSDAGITMYPVEIAKAIIAVKKQVKQLGNSDRNEHGKYSYVSVDKFYERIGKLMADAGLALLIDETGSEIKAGGKEGNAWLFAHYELRFLQESGAVSEPLRRSLAMPISGPQAYGAAQSYIEKQFLRQVFKIPTGEKDADDTAQTDEPPPRQAPRAGMVRAADVPPRQHVREAWDDERPSQAQKQNGNGNGNGNGKTPVEHPKRQEALDAFNGIKASIAAATTPKDVEGIIAHNSAALQLIKEVHNDSFLLLMSLASRHKTDLLASA